MHLCLLSSVSVGLVVVALSIRLNHWLVQYFVFFLQCVPQMRPVLLQLNEGFTFFTEYSYIFVLGGLPR